MRRYNVIEYKSPTDNLSIDDFYKTLGYACLFKGYGTNVNQIPTNELTISIFYEAYPRKMLLTIEMEGHTTEEKYPGIPISSADCCDKAVEKWRTQELKSFITKCR